MWGGGQKTGLHALSRRNHVIHAPPLRSASADACPLNKNGLWWRCVHTRAFYSCNSVLADYQRGVHIMYIMLSFVFVLLFCVFLVNEAVRHVGSSTLPPTGSLCCPCRVYLWCSMGGIFPPIPPRITPSHLMLFLFRRDG
ncbi:unnamed protein product [Ascophyllum nodosum]